MRKRLILAAAALAAVGLGGCASGGNLVVPPHVNSAWAGEDTTCIAVKHAEPPSLESFWTAGAVTVAEMGLSWAYDSLLAMGESEAGRYSASYSGRTIVPVYRLDTDPKDNSQIYRVPTSITFYRLVPPPPATQFNRSNCADKSNNTVFEISFKVVNQLQVLPAKPDDEDGAGTKAPGKGKANVDEGKVMMYRLVPERVILKKVKAKVPVMSWWRPWTWALLLEREYGLVDLNVKVGLSANVVTTDRIVANLDIAQINFPLGKLALPKEGGQTEISADKKAALASDWFQLPTSKQLATNVCEAGQEATCDRSAVGQLTVTVAVEESNDLGDVLKKELENSKDKKDGRIKKLTNQLESKL